MNVRFTAYISERERNELDRVAAEMNTSANSVLRIAIRKYLGITRAAPQEGQSKVTVVTRNQ